jgi:hypothetical protein
MTTKSFCIIVTALLKADATDAITLFESKDYSLFVFCGELTILPKVTDDEWKGGECASMSATGVPYVQSRERPK